MDKLEEQTEKDIKKSILFMKRHGLLVSQHLTKRIILSFYNSNVISYSSYSDLLYWTETSAELNDSI